MTRTRRPLTSRDREARRAAQRALVTAAIEQLRSSDGWHAYLKGRARFRTYSARDVVMILEQHPTAERVAGFRAWLALGYCPAKGSRAICIWAPCAPSKRALQVWRAASADPATRPRPGWRLASVFAQDQVTELPPPAVPLPLQTPVAEITGDSHQTSSRDSPRSPPRSATPSSSTTRVRPTEPVTPVSDASRSPSASPPTDGW
jgi:N-terminal domain of anti-restriction factor ArdC